MPLIIWQKYPDTVIELIPCPPRMSHAWHPGHSITRNARTGAYSETNSPCRGDAERFGQAAAMACDLGRWPSART